MFVNTLGNRSFNDLSQYPIFPWVISDYSSPDLDFDNPATFRDLSKPIGAINKHRLQKYRDFYKEMLENKHTTSPYLYATFYSYPGLITYYLIRQVPEMLLKLQNGIYGPLERILRSIEGAWYQSINGSQDFKELTPEFYYTEGQFLVNTEKMDLGVSQEGENIDDVVLPPWARNSQEFTCKMRAALESDYVSSKIHQWIDLVFGYKQVGEQAALNDNLFYPLTYEEEVNWEEIKTPLHKISI